MKVKIRDINEHFVSKNTSLKSTGDKKIKENPNLQWVFCHGEWMLIRKDLNQNFIELNHGNIILDIVGKTTGKKMYKRGDNYLLS